MRRFFRFALWAMLATVLLCLLGGGLIWWALGHVPGEYSTLLAVAPAAQAARSDAMLRETTRLVSDVKRPGTWETIVTADEINGWLAYDVPRNHPDLLPEELKNPRVAIHPGTLVLYAEVAPSGSVMSLEIEPRLVEGNQMALCIRRLRAGRLPLPLGKVVEGVSQAAEQSGVRLRWQQAGGTPVAILPMDAPADSGAIDVRIESIELGEGELAVRGATQRRDDAHGDLTPQTKSATDPSTPASE